MPAPAEDDVSNGPERIWRDKSDEDLLHAAASLDDFTVDMQQALRAEIARRGLEAGGEQTGAALPAATTGDDPPRSEAERLWREKSDDDLLEAAENLDDLPVDAQLALGSEMERRGLDAPGEPAGGTRRPEYPAMSDMDRIWREKSDEDLLEAAANLDDFTEEGRRAVRAELKRRGLEDPVEQAGEAATAEPPPEGEEPPQRSLLCVRCDRPLDFAGVKILPGDAGHLFENSEALEMYACPKCGHVELFISGSEPEADQ